MPGYAIFIGKWVKHDAEDVANALDIQIMKDPDFDTKDYEIWLSPRDFSRFKVEYKSFFYQIIPDKHSLPTPSSILVGVDWDKYDNKVISIVEFKVFDLPIVISPQLSDGEFLIIHKQLRPLIDMLVNRAYKMGNDDCEYKQFQLRKYREEYQKECEKK